MAQVPAGTSFALATAFGSAITTTALTNATECVVTTSSAHSLSNGDIVEVTSGWGRLNGRVARIKAASGSTLTLEGLDTTSTTFYPAGSGTGSVRKITTFTPILKVLTATPSGGDPKNVEYQYMENDVASQINDGFTPNGMTMEIDADGIADAGYLALRAATETGSTTCVRVVSRSGASQYQPGTVALNEAVIMQSGQVNRVRCAVLGSNRVTRYAS